MAPDIKERLQKSRIVLSEQEQAEFMDYIRDRMFNKFGALSYEGLIAMREKREFNSYLKEIINDSPSLIFSGIFTDEFDADLTKLSFFDEMPFEAGKTDYKRIESENNHAEAVRELARIARDHSWPQRINIIQEELKYYSLDFRKKVIVTLLYNEKGEALDLNPIRLREILKGLLFPSDAFTILADYTGDSLPQTMSESLDPTYAQELAGLCDWLMNNKPSHFSEFKPEFLNGYLVVKLKSVEGKMKEDYLRNNPGKRFEDLAPEELAALSHSYMDTTFAFDVLSKISQFGSLEMAAESSRTAVGPRNNFTFGIIGDDINRYLSGETADNTREIKIPSALAPVAFFEGFDYKSISSDILRQRLFRLMFDFNLDQLSALAKAQKKVREGQSFVKGRVDLDIQPTKVMEILDAFCLPYFKSGKSRAICNLF